MAKADPRISVEIWRERLSSYRDYLEAGTAMAVAVVLLYSVVRWVNGAEARCAARHGDWVCEQGLSYSRHSGIHRDVQVCTCRD